MKLLAAAATILITACSGFSSKTSTVPSPYETHDSEFLYWCEKEGVWPVSAEMPATCEPENVSRGEWDHLPILVNAESSLMEETMAAIQGFNDQLGFDMFEYQPGNMDPDIAVVVMGDHFYAAAEAKQITVDGRRYGAVLVYNGVEANDRDDIMMHELGHLVGLRHDHDNKHSIMFPARGYRIARLEKQDVVALRSVYVGR